MELQLWLPPLFKLSAATNKPPGTWRLGSKASACAHPCLVSRDRANLSTQVKEALTPCQISSTTQKLIVPNLYWSCLKATKTKKKFYRSKQGKNFVWVFFFFKGYTIFKVYLWNFNQICRTFYLANLAKNEVVWTHYPLEKNLYSFCWNVLILLKGFFFLRIYFLKCSIKIFLTFHLKKLCFQLNFHIFLTLSQTVSRVLKSLLLEHSHFYVAKGIFVERDGL